MSSSFAHMAARTCSLTGMHSSASHKGAHVFVIRSHGCENCVYFTCTQTLVALGLNLASTVLFGYFSYILVRRLMLDITKTPGGKLSDEDQATMDELLKRQESLFGKKKVDGAKKKKTVRQDCKYIRILAASVTPRRKNSSQTTTPIPSRTIHAHSSCINNTTAQTRFTVASHTAPTPSTTIHPLQSINLSPGV